VAQKQKVPGSGRKVGTPNLRTVEVQKKLDELGCDPIEGMARIALDESVDLQIRAAMYKELAQYVAPKRKALEHSGDGSAAIPIVVING